MPREDFAVRGMMPEMDPYEVSPLAVQRPVTAQPDLSQFDFSQFQDFNPLDGANFSGAFGGSGSASPMQGAPTSFAIPENYGNPKNKIYNLTANPDDGIRLKLVDGTVVYEGQGPEAAAKASEIIQKLGKDFGTQSTWILDKQTAGGDWKQVSQDTVGEKKKTALNAFLDVAAPIAGAALSVFVPGAAALFGGQAGAAAAGAGAGSLLNSGLQNQNSAEAFKKAAIAAAGSYLGAQIAPNVSSALKGLTNAASPLTTAGTQAVAQGGAGALTQAGTGALLDAIPEIVVTGARNAVSTGLGSGFGAGAGSLIPKPTFDASQYKVNDFKVKPDQVVDTPNIDELVITGSKPSVDPLTVVGAGTTSAFPKLDTSQFEVKPFEPTPEPAPTDNIEEIVVTAKPKIDPLTVAGAGVPTPTFDTSPFEVKPFDTTPKPPAPTDNIEEIVVTAPKKITPIGALGAGVTLTGPTTPPPPPPPPIEEIVVPGTRPVKTDQVIPAAAGAGAGALVNATPPPPPPTIEEIIIQAEKLPEKVQYKPAAEAAAGIAAANTLANALDATPKTPMEKAQDWIKKNPLQAASLGLTALSGLAAGTKGGTGSGSTGNMPGNIGAAGTRASLSPTFTTGTLPPVSGTFAGGALSGTRTPAAMDMSTDDWLRYGLRPEKNFFAAPTPVAQEIPVKKARGGSMRGTPRKGRSEFAVHGAGTGRSDDIPAVLSDGEYVMDAETVALLGDGSNKAGAEKLDQLRVNLRRHKGANLAKGRFSVNAKSPEKYLAGGRV